MLGYRNSAHTPTWCNADMSLQQIKRGVASGNRIALYARSFFQYHLFQIGCFVQKYAWSTILVSLTLYTICCAGLRDVIIETDIVKLWVQQGGRLNEEINFINDPQNEGNRIRKRSVTDSNYEIRAGSELPRESGLGGGFQLVIQTPVHDHENVLSKEPLLRHVKLMEEIANYEVELYDEKWTLSDICFKPPSPHLHNGPVSKLMSQVIDRIIPCIWITPIDCYWEGSKPLGPHPPINLGDEVSGFISSLPKGNVTWKNLNPTAVMTEVGQLFDIGPIGNFFERAGIGAAYLDRPCIDPLDVECPEHAPNHFDRCTALEKFNEWNMAKPDSEKIELERKPILEKDCGNESSEISDSIFSQIFGRKKRDVITTTTTTTTTTSTTASTTTEDYYDAYDDYSDYYLAGITNLTYKPRDKIDPKTMLCLEYGESLLKWMRENPHRWGEFLMEKEMPKNPDYEKVMTGGCKGFGKRIMEWPEDLIIGGIHRNSGMLSSAEALQSVFLVASPADVFLRFKDQKDSHPHLDIARWNTAWASDIIYSWQRNFTQKLYGHQANNNTERVFHPLASTSIADMLEEFSQFNYTIIIMGYVLMVIYAAFTQARIDGRWLAIKSNVALSFVGVILVTYSSICGLGMTTALGIHFNAATTQIVPFLSLGLGIDDMFLLLHNYDEIIHTMRKNEMGILLKETGMSVMVTSINNILAFCAGYILPIPALRSFCSQTAVLLAFNLMSLMFIFPAFIGLDLRRVRAGRRDLVYCGPPSDPHSEKGEKLPYNENLTNPAYTEAYTRDQPWYTVGGFLTLFYIPLLKRPTVKALVLLITIGGVIFGLYGMYTTTLGLELADVLPENTAPAAFLKAREKYFSFYPMFAVLRGKNIDFPNQQRLIDEYREALGSTSYMVKANGNLQPYWMSMLRVWLESLQEALDKEIAKGTMDPITGMPIKGMEKPPPEALIARRLVCSYGENYNCTGRIGHIKMVENGIIRPESFYNYLTGWYNIDNMMYYVSQASFKPPPPYWQMSSSETVVPPARPLLYCQIPFYQTNLTDTPVTVNMIEEVRAVCDAYTAKGLPNFPNGLAFTFWEQYLFLRWNLFCAICVIAFAVFAVISLLMFNPWAAAMVMVIVVIVTIELGGCMGLVGIKMNPISAVTLISAVGIVQRNASFQESNSQLMWFWHFLPLSVQSMIVSNRVCNICLYQYFMVPYQHCWELLCWRSPSSILLSIFLCCDVAVILLAVFNGLCLLPVLLTLVGPNPEIVPNDGSSRLPPPPPLIEQKMKSSLSIENGFRHRKGADVEMSAR
ncbi:Protein phosphatase type 2C 3 [Parelaphostrongylus tenuis]|uniref:Protein phosphatase type 2C 3 n=1 Tax=Parelaphostrongylus tenuis TaxID=148309 RepID=A0AAD5RDW6_PARTN|nr:Protein phosphatase type 2C 3 [Parelaphostrongylus tenuis]